VRAHFKMPLRVSSVPAMGQTYDDLMDLATIGGEGTSVTRLAWSSDLRRAYTWLDERCRALGLDTEIDAAGNFLARWNVGSGPALLVGSHVDTVRRGGRFDGALGVVAGLNAIALLKERGVSPARPVWLVAFMDEESTRFGTALFGSRAFVGDDVSGLGDRVDDDGMRLDAAMREWDRDIARTGEARRIQDAGSYLELHAEQGPRLEAAGNEIGVVTSIVGLTGYRVTLQGETNHAGTTPMETRRDALAGAARMALMIREETLKRAGATGNVGTMSLPPGSANVIPGEAEFLIDIRAPSDAELAGLDSAVCAGMERIAAEEQLQISIDSTYRIPASPMDPALVDTVERAAAAERTRHVRMASGAGHDAMTMARHVPSAMIFVPSRGGISHNPDEYTSPEHCDVGTRVLARAMESLATA
jgi:allantoate deiminase